MHLTCIRFVEKLIVCVIAVIMFFSAEILASTPLNITFQATIASQQDGFLQGYKKVNVSICEGTRVKWSETHKSVPFSNGVCSIILGNKREITEETFNLDDPRFKITVSNYDGSNVQEIEAFPIPVIPYAVQAKVADTVLSIDASNIKGSFTSKVDIQSDLVVSNNLLYVDSKSGKVGINNSNPAYLLDVAGKINAEGYKINGNDLEMVLSWQKKKDVIYYNEGSVGIGTSTPDFKLDVEGTVNANEYKINGLDLGDVLRAELSWQDGAARSIYYHDGSYTELSKNVGIGTGTPNEKLHIEGAIRIAHTREPYSEPGTIQFKDGDFLGCVDTNTWRTLTGLKGEGIAGSISFWQSDDQIGSSPDLVWNNDSEMMGIGTDSPGAKLEVKGTGDVDLLHIKDEYNNTILIVSTPNVGIGTANPKEKLTVQGYIDAQGYTIKGEPLEFAFSSRSHWYKENNGRIFYDTGFVGIGTSEPRNLLELASATGNPALTFDTFGEDLFTIGMDVNNPNAFIIARGGDLSKPVFLFKENKIGVGLSTPNANLHVSGDAGVVFQGTYIPEGTVDRPELIESGGGTRMIWFPVKAAFRAGSVLYDNWDNHNIGDFSVAFGFDPLAKGFASSVGGGYQNRSAGAYSVVPGGLENIASGNYSFAAGYKASASNSNSFVWSDYTPSENSFGTKYSNQFLIRAYNGVGIGTSETKGAVLTVARDTPGQLLFKGIDANGEACFVITTSGNVGIGTTKPGDARLAVNDGRVGIGTTDPEGLLTIDGQGSTDYLLMVSEQDSPTVAMLISSSGNVGIGVTRNYKFVPGGNPPEVPRLVVQGGIRASKYTVVDPNDPKATWELKQSQGSPWSEKGSDIFYSQGRVGIGTATPNSLLELSNQNINGDIPVITFDIDNKYKYSMGVTINDSESFFTIQPGQGLSLEPSLTIVTRSIGIGTHLNVPSATLHVVGNTIIDGNFVVGSTDTSSQFFSMVVDGAINVTTLNIGGEAFVPSPSPWITRKQEPKHIYYGITSNEMVGIGTSEPKAKLDVRGTVSANNLSLSGPISIGNTLAVERLEIEDSGTLPDEPTSGVLYVEDMELKYKDPQGSIKIISSPLRKGDPAGTPGTLAFWIDDTTIGESGVIWDESEPNVVVSGNLVVSRNYINGGLSVSSYVEMGAPKALIISANLTHEGDLYETDSYTAHYIDVNIDKKWGYPDTNKAVDIKGLDISMKTKEGEYIYNLTDAVGLMIDVSSVNIQSGRKAAAVFMGGNVGIGTLKPDPEALLEVAGMVSCNSFNLTGGLNVPELVVGDTTFIATSKIVKTRRIPRIGIGLPLEIVENSDAELNVNGTISSNILLVSGGIKTVTLNIGEGTLVVNSSGNVGIGTANPNAQIELIKDIRSVSDVPDATFISEQLGINIDGDLPGNPFYLNKDIKGFNVEFVSESDNTLKASATGIKIDMSKLRVQENLQDSQKNKIVGLHVDVSGVDDAERYAALFMGGSVGIGTYNRNVALAVSGDIIATNLVISEALIASSGNFKFLKVENGASFNGVVSINNLVVKGTATINILRLEHALEAAQARFATIDARYASINKLLEASVINVTTLNATTGSFIDSLGIGQDAPIDFARWRLAVSGNMYAKYLDISNEMTLSSATLNVNDGAIYVPANEQKVGIGTTRPYSLLHIAGDSLNSFNPANNRSWNALRIQTYGNASNLAAGLLLVPHDDDSNVPSSSVGSGIVAIRSVDDNLAYGSHLAFITDPAYDVSAERMRITNEGNVGIGINAPEAMLHVNGTSYFNKSVDVKGALVVSKLRSQSSINVEPDGIFSVFGTVSANMDVQVEEGIYFKDLDDSAVIDNIDNYAGLFVQSSHLYFTTPDGATTVNISKPFIGAPGKIPFFNVDGQLDDSAPFYWFEDRGVLSIGTGNVKTSLEISATFNNETQGEIAAHKINVNVGDRSDSTESAEFKGMDINFNAQDPSGAFGRLADNDVAIGLNVDVSKLSARYYDNQSNLKGYKYAAAFSGGNVGVGTSRPQAALHIYSDDSDLLRLDTGKGLIAMVVNQEGNVGIGTSEPDSRLTIKTKSGLPALHIAADNQTIMYIDDKGNVGIGTTDPSANLHVQGRLTAAEGYFDSLEATTMNVGEGYLYVDAAGNVGIGTTRPVGNIDFYKGINNSMANTSFVSQKMTIELAGGVEQSPRYFDKNLTGYQIILDSNNGNQFGGSSLAPVATGVSINMSDLIINSGAKAKVYGLYVDVAGEYGDRYAAIFNGGRVGIGTSTPAVALDVSGDVRAKGIRITDSFEVDVATFNRIYVNNTSSFNGVVEANSLYTSTVSANKITVDGTFSVATASVSTFNADYGYFTKGIGIGIDRDFKDFDLDNFVLDVSGDVKINGEVVISELTVSTLNHSLIPLTSTIDVVGNLNISGSVVVEESLLVGKTAALRAGQSIEDLDNEYGRLFVDEYGDLRYCKPKINYNTALTNPASPVNLSSLTGEPGRIPVYDDSLGNKGNLTDSANLLWYKEVIGTKPNSSNYYGNVFKIGTANISQGDGNMTSVIVTSNLSPYNLSDEYSASKISLYFDNRLAVQDQTTKFTGLKIDFDAVVPDQYNDDFGRLAQNETAVGLKVDVGKVAARYATDLQQNSVAGFKYSALFLGGSVGIGTETPEAALHITNTQDDTKSFQVDTRSGSEVQPRFVIDGSGYVGVGTTLPDTDIDAQLTVKGTDNYPVMHVKNNNSGVRTAIYVDADARVGMGLTNPVAQLHVSGNFKVQAGNNKNALIVTTDGKVGIGTDMPSANLHIAGSDVPLIVQTADGGTALRINKEGDSFLVGIGITDPKSVLHVDGVIFSGTETVSGIPSWISSDNTYGLWTGSGADHMFFGLKQNNDNEYEGTFYWSENEILQYGTSINNNIMVLTNQGTGFGTDVIDAQVHVSGNFLVETPQGDVSLLITKNVSAGSYYVGIGTTAPEELLDVRGVIMAETLEVTNKEIYIATLDIKGSLNINKEISNDTVTRNGHVINVDLAHDFRDKILVGLNLNLSSDFSDPDEGLGERRYSLWGQNSYAYGLKVDVKDLLVGDTSMDYNFFGSKYAAVFLGGNVGIGLTNPVTPLHVRGVNNEEQDIARFGGGGSGSDLTIHNYKFGKIGFYMKTSAGDFQNAFVINPNNRVVGIGTQEIDVQDLSVVAGTEALVVNGDIRLGLIRNGSYNSGDSYGNKLHFSGGPHLAGSDNSENNHDLWIGRYNADSKKSELRVNISANTVDNANLGRFVVGYTSNEFKKILQVQNDNKVGIQDGDQTGFIPKTTLHIKGEAIGNASDTDGDRNHLAIIENTGAQNANGLAIVMPGRISTVQPNIGQTYISDQDNYITFYMGTIPVGSIEGNNSSGIRFKTPGADYAEYLPKMNKKDSFHKGDVVGVINGRITKKTANAQQIMVISTAASVAGNDPGDDQRDLYELVSFFGQVPVRVRGRVKVGDYLIPSGDNDGAAIAVRPDKIKTDNMNRIVGRAWEGSDKYGESYVNTAVGFIFSLPSLEKDMVLIDKLKEEITDLKEERQDMSAELDRKLEEQNKELESLTKEIEQLKNR